MTWIRVDTTFPDHELRGTLAEALAIDPDRASMALLRVWCKFGEYRQDGQASAISDTTLEEWAHWTGKRGRFAAAFREHCVDGSEGDAPGKVKGWWRQEALLRHQRGKKNRPSEEERRGEDIAQDLREDCEETAGERRSISAGNGDGDGNSNRTNQSPPGTGRLIAALGRDPARFAVMDLFEHLPPEEKPEAWAGVLLSCLQGGMAQGKSATIAQLASACADYPAVAKERWGPRHFRACVQRVVDGDRLNQRTGPRSAALTRTERAAAAGDAWLAEHAGKEAP